MLFTQLFESDFDKKLKETYDDYEDCSYCSGTGEGRYEGSSCSHCGGSGVEPESDNDDVDPTEDDWYDDSEEPESYHEKSLRTRNLEESVFLREDRQRIYEQWNRVGKRLVEYQLSPQQVQALFGQIEQASTAAGGNRTLAGRGVDKASELNTAWEDLKGKIQQSHPVKGFDDLYDTAAAKLKTATGGDQGVMQYVNKYRAFAKEHPYIQSAVYAALVAAAGLSGAGLGGAAALGLLKMTDRLLQGDKASSALYKGAKTGALAYGASQLAQYFKNPNAAIPPGTPAKLLDGTDYVVQKGDTLSQIAQKNGVSVKDLMAANSGQTVPTGDRITWNDPNAFTDINPMGDAVPAGTGSEPTYDVRTKLTNPDVLQPGQKLNVPGSLGPTQTYADGVGTAADTWNKVNTGEYTPSEISRNQAAKWNLPGAGEYRPTSGTGAGITPPTTSATDIATNTATNTAANAATSNATNNATNTATNTATNATTNTAANAANSGKPSLTPTGDETNYADSKTNPLDRANAKVDADVAKANAEVEKANADAQAKYDAEVAKVDAENAKNSAEYQEKFDSIPADQRGIATDENGKLLPGWVKDPDKPGFLKFDPEAAANMPSGPSLSLSQNGNNITGTLKLPDGRELPTMAIPSDSNVQPRFPAGSEKVTVDFNGQKYDARIVNGQAYITGFDKSTLVSPGTLRESKKLSEARIHMMFDSIVAGQKKLNEGMWDTVKGAAAKASNWAQTKGHNITTKVTLDKLLQAWNKAQKPMDSETIKNKVLIPAGVAPEIIDSVYASMKIPAALAPTAAQQTGIPGRIEPTMTATPAATPAARPAASTTAPASVKGQLPANASAWNYSGAVKTPGVPQPAAKTTATQPAALPSWADPKSGDYVGRREVARRQAAQQAQPAATAVAEADKKKEDDLEPQIKDVGLQRAISRAKADFPTAGSGIEALSKDFMRSQEQDQQSFDQIRQAERQQDQMLAKINRIDQEQEQEIQGLEKQNSTLANRLQQLQSVNSQLEKKLANMSGRREKASSEKEKVSSEPATTGVGFKAPTAAAEPTAKSASKSNAKPTPKNKPVIKQLPAPTPGARAFGSMTPALAAAGEPQQSLFPSNYAQDSANLALRKLRQGAQDIDFRDVASTDKLRKLAQREVEPTDENKEEQTPERPEAKYNKKYQDMVSRVGQKAREQEKNKPVDIKDLARRLAAIEASKKDK